MISQRMFKIQCHKCVRFRRSDDLSRLVGNTVRIGRTRRLWHRRLFAWSIEFLSGTPINFLSVPFRRKKMGLENHSISCSWFLGIEWLIETRVMAAYGGLPSWMGMLWAKQSFSALKKIESARAQQEKLRSRSRSIFSRPYARAQFCAHFKVLKIFQLNFIHGFFTTK